MLQAVGNLYENPGFFWMKALFRSVCLVAGACECWSAYCHGCHYNDCSWYFSWTGACVWCNTNSTLVLRRNCSRTGFCCKFKFQSWLLQITGWFCQGTYTHVWHNQRKTAKDNGWCAPAWYSGSAHQGKYLSSVVVVLVVLDSAAW